MTDQPMLGRFCQWCAEPAVDSVEIQPAQYRIVTKISSEGQRIHAPEVVRFAITADVCACHRSARDREGGKPMPDMRRRKAIDVEQLDIFGGSTADPVRVRKPNNAIKGEQ